MTEKQQARLDALLAAGWRLVEAPSVDEQHAKTRVTAPFQMERYFGTSPIREHAESLDKLLEVTEWQQRRIDSLDTSARTVIVSDVVNTEDYKTKQGGQRA